MAYTSVVTSKGTITLPAPLRKALHLSPGKKVRLELEGDRIVVNAPPDIEALRERNKAHIRALKIKPATDADIDAAVSRGVIEREERAKQ